VMVGDGIVIYGQASGLPLDMAKHLTSWVMVGMLIGYLAGVGLTPRFISQQRYLAISAVLGVLFAFGAWQTHGTLSVGFVAALGFANAMMWPAIFPLAIKGLGDRTELGSALLIMGIAGGALIPQLFVHLEEIINFQLAFLVVMVPGYLYILFYGLLGHKAGQAGRTDAIDSATATIRDVTKQARVSLKTVSRVINREDSVREETRDRVLRAIEQLGYRPDL